MAAARGAALATLTALTVCGVGGCGDDASGTSVDPAAAATQDPADERPAAAVIEAILDGCHGQRRGTFECSAFELRPAGGDAGSGDAGSGDAGSGDAGSGDGAVDKIRVDLPRGVRIERADGRQLLLHGDEGLAWTKDQAPGAATGDELALLHAVRDGAVAMFLLPLLDARDAERTARDAIRFTAADGTRWDLVYDPATDTPVRLGPSSERQPAVVFVRHYDSGVTRIPIEVQLRGIGARRVKVIDAGVYFEPRAFEPPTPDGTGVPATVVAETEAGRRLRIARVERPGDPTLETVGEKQWFVAVDPGAWGERLKLLDRVGRKLFRLGWWADGDPFVYEVDGAGKLAFPIKAAPDRETRPVELDDGQMLTTVASHRAVVLEVPQGPYPERVDVARRRLRSFLVERELAPGGPVRLVFDPGFQDKDPQTQPAALATAWLRVELPTR